MSLRELSSLLSLLPCAGALFCGSCADVGCSLACEASYDRCVREQSPSVPGAPCEEARARCLGGCQPQGTCSEEASEGGRL